MMMALAGGMHVLFLFLGLSGSSAIARARAARDSSLVSRSCRGLGEMTAQGVLIGISMG